MNLLFAVHIENESAEVILEGVIHFQQWIVCMGLIVALAHGAVSIKNISPRAHTHTHTQNLIWLSTATLTVFPQHAEQAKRMDIKGHSHPLPLVFVGRFQLSKKLG